MTQHIEPAAWMWTDSTGCVHMAGDRPDIYTAAATVAQLPEPLSDAQAALAAAEERGRIEERERLFHENGTPRFNAVCARAEAAEARIAELEKRLADAERVIEPLSKWIVKDHDPTSVSGWRFGIRPSDDDFRAARAYMEGK